MAERQRATAEDRAWVVAEWEASGQSAAAFSQTIGIAKCTLYGWRRQIRAKAKQSAPASLPADLTAPGGTPSPESMSPSFAEVILRPAAPSAAPQLAEPVASRIEITIRDAVVRVGREFDDHQLRRVLNVLRSAG